MAAWLISGKKVVRSDNNSSFSIHSICCCDLLWFVAVFAVVWCFFLKRSYFVDCFFCISFTRSGGPKPEVYLSMTWIQGGSAPCLELGIRALWMGMTRSRSWWELWGKIGSLSWIWICFSFSYGFSTSIYKHIHMLELDIFICLVFVHEVEQQS